MMALTTRRIDAISDDIRNSRKQSLYPYVLASVLEVFLSSHYQKSISDKVYSYNKVWLDVRMELQVQDVYWKPTPWSKEPGLGTEEKSQIINK